MMGELRFAIHGGIALSIALGIVAIAALLYTLFFLYRRWSQRRISRRTPFLSPLPIRVEVGGKPILYRYLPEVRNRSSQVVAPGVEMRIPVPSKGAFSLIPERAGDRLFKRWGFIRENRCSVPELDRQFLVFAPDTATFNRLLQDMRFQRALASLWNQGVREFHHDGESLMLRWRPFHEDPSAESLHFMAAAGETAEEMASAIRTAYQLTSNRSGVALWRSRESWMEWKRPFRLVLPLIFSFLAVAFSVTVYPPLEGWKDAPPGVWAGVAVGVVTVGFVRRSFGPLVLSGRVIAMVLVLWGMAAALTGAGAFYWSNGYFDDSAARSRELEILGKRVRKRKSIRYLVRVKSWNPGEPVRELTVPYSVYRQVQVGRSMLILDTKPGRWGVEWRSGVRIAPFDVGESEVAQKDGASRWAEYFRATADLRSCSRGGPPVLYNPQLSPLPDEEKQQLYRLFRHLALLAADRGERILYLMGEGRTPASERKDLVRGLERLSLSVEPVVQARDRVLSAVNDQKEFFALWEQARARGTKVPVERREQIPQGVHQASRRLREAFQILIKAYPNEAPHNRKAFSYQLCSLDFL